MLVHREEDSHGWRHGDDLVFEGEDFWLDALQKALESVMFLKRKVQLWWQESDDKHVTILNRLIDFRDSGGERVATLEPDPRHMDLVDGVRSIERLRRLETTRLRTTIKRC